MFDIGGTEMLVVGIVALIVVGPKDLPRMFKTVGKFVGKAKGMAREFSRAMNDAADGAGMGEINKTLKAAANPKAYGLDKVREATNFAADKPTLSPERAEAAKKMSEKGAEMATKRREREAADAAQAVQELSPPVEGDKATTSAAKPAAVKKPAAKKAAVKKAPAKKPAAKKPAAKKTPAKKPVAKKPALRASKS